MTPLSIIQSGKEHWTICISEVLDRISATWDRKGKWSGYYIQWAITHTEKLDMIFDVTHLLLVWFRREEDHRTRTPWSLAVPNSLANFESLDLLCHNLGFVDPVFWIPTPYKGWRTSINTELISHDGPVYSLLVKLTLILFDNTQYGFSNRDVDGATQLQVILKLLSVNTIFLNYKVCSCCEWRSLLYCTADIQIIRWEKENIIINILMGWQ